MLTDNGLRCGCALSIDPPLTKNTSSTTSSSLIFRRRFVAPPWFVSSAASEAPAPSLELSLPCLPWVPNFAPQIESMRALSSSSPTALALAWPARCRTFMPSPSFTAVAPTRMRFAPDSNAFSTASGKESADVANVALFSMLLSPMEFTAMMPGGLPCSGP